MTECEHLSGTGIDQAEEPCKIWRCDGCGRRYLYVRAEHGVVGMLTRRWIDPPDGPDRVELVRSVLANHIMVAPLERAGRIADEIEATLVRAGW